MIKMRRVDSKDWPTNKPGDFSIDPPNESDKGQLGFCCPNGRNCSVLLRSGEFKSSAGVNRWGFDGNVDLPTLTPSIHCGGEGGCGWHGFIELGVMKNA